MATKIQIPATAVTGFIGSFAAGDTATLARVAAVAEALHANNVGEKGAPSQNATLRALSEAIEAKLGNNAVHRTGWKFANLGNYARVVRAIESLTLSLESAKLVVVVYSVQNVMRDKFSEFIDAHKGDEGTPKQREAALIKAANELFADRTAAEREAKAQREAEAEAKKAAKAEGTDEAEGTDDNAGVTLPKSQTPAAFLQSLREAIEGQTEWKTRDYKSVAEGLRALADTLYEVEPVADEAVKA